MAFFPPPKSIPDPKNYYYRYIIFSFKEPMDELEPQFVIGLCVLSLKIHTLYLSQRPINPVLIKHIKGTQD